MADILTFSSLYSLVSEYCEPVSTYLHNKRIQQQCDVVNPQSCLYFLCGMWTCASCSIVGLTLQYNYGGPCAP